MAAEHYSQSAAAGVDFDVADYERVDFTKLNLDLPRYAPIRADVRRHFGFEPKAFQVSAIADIIEGEKDVFVIAGTNSGKSLLYQAVPVVKESAICLVICPTLALMSDQVGILWPLQSQR
jgi:superfamily II DNA helicase RecQ